ncbi:protein-L-isoaspartate(D-aspartate) O-methyltransferase [Halorussus halophilus]|uniref:protein-L-isoaspartate(D-aspartate) O-methyltransferase n=1 Tax=Halorussus halophilus TaxID=2650975 RepID=UPI0013010BE6|nr:protein-L-isoaspartate(D-aspartate) O-methyltransferase [Halorussus halophilus]
MFGGGDTDDDFERARDRMVERLARREDIERDSTLDALRAVPRHEFVPTSRRSKAYEDRPLPIGRDQTISAPHMVAMMVEMLALDSGDEVLEIGTGCGYHAAVTAEVVGAANVYSVEYHDTLATQTRERLERLGYEDISIRVGDGNDGWSEHAPYDAAYLTCAAPEFPQKVVEQVRPEGELLAPIGTTTQRLVYARKRADGGLDRETKGPVRFVRMQDD